MREPTDRQVHGDFAPSPHGELTPAQVTEEASLRRGAIDWKQVGILTVAGCGPASVIALNLQFMGQFAGAALVLAFVLVWPGILLLVNTGREPFGSNASTIRARQGWPGAKSGGARPRPVCTLWT